MCLDKHIMSFSLVDSDGNYMHIAFATKILIGQEVDGSIFIHNQRVHAKIGSKYALDSRTPLKTNIWDIL